MAELKTQPNDLSVEEFIATQNERTRRDCTALVALMSRITGEPPRMWGTNIVGFGTYRYRYASGHEGEWFLTGFAPRKSNLSLYLMCGLESQKPLLEQLGNHKIGKGCLYVKNLDDVDMAVLEELVTSSVEKLRTAHGS